MAGEDDTLEWVFKLIDELTDPAAREAYALKALDAQLKIVTEDSTKLEQAHHAGGKAAEEHRNKFEGLLEKFAEWKLIEEARDAIKEVTVELVKSAIEASDFEQRTSIAFKALTGSAEEAERVMAQAKQFSLKAAMPVDEVLKQYQQLLLAKFPAVEIPVVLQGASDLSALGGGRVSVDTLVDAFARLRNEGALTSHSLRMLRSAGLDLEDLAKRLGAGSVHELTKQLEKNPVDAATGLDAILRTIADKEGGVLGTTTLEMAETVTGSITRIKNAWTIMLGDFEKAPEFESFRKALSEVADLMAPGGEQAKKLEEALGQTLQLGVSFVTDVLQAMPAFFDALTDQSQPFFDNFKLFWGEGKDVNLSEIFTQAGHAILAAADLLQIFLKGLQKIGEFLDLLQDGFHQWGRAVEHVENLFSHGQWADNDQLEDTGAAGGRALGQGIESGAKDALQIHSPSKVFEEMGDNSSEGFRRGFDNKVLEAPDTGVAGGRSSGGVTVHAPVHIEVHGHVDEDTLKRLEDLIPGQIASAVEQAAAELGSP